ncbi:5'-3' exonuclease [Staphylococcus sp. SQ8-PEA]|uniref:5'-3' exonuclease n=1 Tax=Staphylococcus marylandisciuri TaxID=2981529 RepID=A0ABT2QNH2_9STAP|nr:5'-3' exonuclease [Staphylococcus marylandisciuri]MCU5745509.1 5'-3' exonuclease [Staphylococcus marylandisciuri]
MSHKVLLIDGMALLFRHFYATSFHNQFMRNSQGVPTNGIQGFIRHIYSAIDQIHPTHVAICWDMGQETFRTEMYKNYKKHRPAPPEELIPQFNYVKEVAEELGFTNMGLVNYEADDIIGTLAKAYSAEHNVVVITGDKDILQCISPHVEVWLTKKGFNQYERYTLHRFQMEYALEPPQLIDVKAFMGDSSDGYSGVQGIGEKTALKLIKNYGSVEKVLDSLEELTSSQRSKINKDVASLKMAKTLATINTELPIDTLSLLPELVFKQNISHALKVCNYHEFFASEKYLASHFL